MDGGKRPMVYSMVPPLRKLKDKISRFSLKLVVFLCMLGNKGDFLNPNVVFIVAD